MGGPHFASEPSWSTVPGGYKDSRSMGLYSEPKGYVSVGDDTIIPRMLRWCKKEKDMNAKKRIMKRKGKPEL